jgi:putative transposase
VLNSNAFLGQKLNYIHQNPVRAEIVSEPEQYLYSSALDYAGEKGLLQIIPKSKKNLS